MKLSIFMRFALGALLLPLCAPAQFTIEGVADRTIYNNSVTLRVVTQPGFDYAVMLNTSSIPAGVSVTVNQPDFYELRATRTEASGDATTNRYLRFIVNATERGTTELGLPPHTPFPVINSAAEEFAGARLRIIAPESFPSGYDIPVVAWVVNEQEQAVRANAQLLADGASILQIRRGVGSGFLNDNMADGLTNIALSVPGITTNLSIAIESNTVWTAVSGVLAGDTSWPANSRIQVTGGITIPNGSTLTIGEGSILRLDSRVDITNNGAVQINGTVENPVVFMPSTNTQPWGGFVMRTTSGTVNATGTIFTGAGAVPNWFGSGGNPGSHRIEQALFYCDGG